MGEDTRIQWCHHTFNGIRGCVKVVNERADLEDSGCSRCYAESMSKRNPKLLGVWGEDGTRVLASDKMWAEPLRWNADAVKAGDRRRVFSYSLGDVFEHPTKPANLAVCEAARARLWPLIERTTSLDWMLLTKRPENIMGMVPKSWRGRFPDNLWAGASIENQRAAITRIPVLVQVPAKVLFLSCEPLIGPVDLHLFTRERQGDGSSYSCIAGPRPKLVIIGGESGGGARPFDIAWARSIIRQCKAASVACFAKQLGAHVIWDGGSSPGEHWPTGTKHEDTMLGHWRARLNDKKGGAMEEWPPDLRIREMPKGV